MKKNIIINLEKVNQPQTYKGTTKTETEVFQYEALEFLNSKFEFFLDIVKKNESIDDDIHKVRRHDTIFIDGDRGSGKTAFLLNIASHIDPKIADQLHFFEPIDPTLLYDNENFLGVVLGAIVKDIHKSGKLQCDDEKTIADYYKNLEKVSESLNAIKMLKNETPKGIDEIAFNASSIALENHVHQFFKSVKNILRKEILVLLIDDVDMAFEKGFDVLETVRKFLASPFVLPIVSGDGALYQRLIKNQFIRAYSNKQHIYDLPETKPYDEAREKIDNMVTQYFNKVMPNDSRIQLKPIFNILTTHRVAVQITEGKFISYSKLKDIEIQSINNKMYRKQATERVFENNTRSFVQYLAKKQPIYKELGDMLKSKEIIFNDATTTYSPYTPDPQNDNIVSSLYKSLELTANFYHLSTDMKKQRLALMLENDVNAIVNEKISTYSVFKGNFFHGTNSENGIAYEGLEPKLTISKGEQKEKNKKGLAHFFDETNGWDYLIMRLFTHDDYYSSASTTRFHIVSGKFLEFMFYTMSLHNKLDMLKIDNDKQEKLYNDINNICSSRPYNLEFPTNNYYEDEVTDEDDRYYRHVFSDDEEKNVYNDIITWNEEHIKSNGLTLNTIQLRNVLNKFFNNLYILKGKSFAIDNKKTLNLENMIKADGHPIFFIYRVYVILLNAIGFFEVKSNPSNTNIAINQSKITKNALSNSQTYRQNIMPLEDEHSSLVYALLNHPLFKRCEAILFYEQKINEAPFDMIQYANIKRDIKDRYNKIRSETIGDSKKDINQESVTKFFNAINKVSDSKALLTEYEKRRKNSRTMEYEIEITRETLSIEKE